MRRALVILFPDEIKNRAFSLIKQGGIGVDGSCKITGVMPGSYRVLAVIPEPYIDLRRVHDWTPYEKLAKTVRFGPRETVQLQLQVVSVRTDEQ